MEMTVTKEEIYSDSSPETGVMAHHIRTHKLHQTGSEVEGAGENADKGLIVAFTGRN